LEPHISEKTLRFHHDKHHAKYVATANDMIKGTDMEGDDVVTVLRKAFNSKNQGLFNNAAQAFNHDFYWNVSFLVPSITEIIRHHSDLLCSA
jgi:Fe-Mn family superoxide dismutase